MQFHVVGDGGNRIANSVQRFVMPHEDELTERYFQVYGSASSFIPDRGTAH